MYRFVKSYDNSAHFTNVRIESALADANMLPEKVPILKRNAVESADRCAKLIAVLVVLLHPGAVRNAVP